MIHEHKGWSEHPFRGEVRELTIVGSGKNRTVQVRVPDGRGFGIPLSYYGGLASVKCCDGIVVTTTKVDDGYVLNGTKMFITNGVHADLYCIAAVSSPDARPSQRLSMWVRALAVTASTRPMMPSMT